MQTDTLSLSAPAPTLFAPCPESPPVLSQGQALPSNRQDFFSVKFLIILWLGPGLEAGASLMCVTNISLCLPCLAQLTALEKVARLACQGASNCYWCGDINSYLSHY